MNRESKRETVIARLIANTRRRKRPNSLIEIARDIRWLQNDLGSLKAVSETIGISAHMLGQFLSVEKLCPEVKELVKERKIDLLNVVRYIRGFGAQAQNVIAREVIADQLSANDIRVLAPLHKSLPHFTVHQLISRVRKSKNVKIYVAYFRIPLRCNNTNALKKRFQRIVGKSEIVSFSVKNLVGTLELTSLGQKKLRDAARERNLSLRKFVDMIVQE
ncbi:MAG: hypothetical protein KAV87_16180 [Desulfobacteraceae bacterium]|jgi:hypothetical protein|nr:hypothetical protein [Desulfobacteraceae bacterium]